MQKLLFQQLRVYVTGGGCSGFQYGFDFAENVAEDDTLIEFGDATLVVDPLSYQYLVTTCGCGASFMV